MASGLSSMATRRLLAALAKAYEARTGRHVAVQSVGGVDAARRVASGEALDFVVLAAAALDSLAADGHIDPGTRTAIARSRVAVAVPAGAPAPALQSEEAVRQAVLDARTIGYSTGPSGRHLAALFERWGIASTIAGRIVVPPPGVPVGELVARGEVGLGFQQLSELMGLPGIDVAGLLPAEIDEVTVFTGAVCAAATQPREALEWLAFCASPGTADAKRAHGMEP